MSKTKLVDVPVGDLRDGAGLRTGFEPVLLDDLARSMKERGVLTPLRVFPAEGGGYVVGLGGRRLLAAREAGLAAVPCVVLPAAPAEAELLTDQLTAHLLTEDLAPLDLARGLEKLQALLGCSQRQLADHLSIDQATVSRSLALLGLAEPVQGLVAAGELAPSTAIRLADLPDVEQQAEAETIVAGRVPRRKIEERTKKIEYPRFELLTPQKWKVVVTAARKRASAAQLLEQLQGLVLKLAAPPLESEAA